jgi:nucleoid-associated protein YgaU
MQRYEEFTETIVANKGKRRYETLYYPKFEKRSSDIYIITKRLDRLDNIAHQYYGDPRFWVIIAKSNKLHAGSIHPPVGFRLRIPYPLNIGDIEERFRNAQF